MNERWKIGIGAGIICILTLWGLWQMMDGMNKPESVQTVAASSASTRTQEKKKPTGIKKNPKETDHTNVTKKYDAARYARGTPLRDPFHVTAIHALNKENNEKAVKGNEGIKGRKAIIPVKKRPLPILQGIACYGEEYRAFIEINGTTEMVKEGDKVETWTVKTIQPQAVTLSGAEGALNLKWR